MNSIAALLILTWNKLLAIFGRALGLFLGGLIVGFMKGIQDQREMTKYLKYKAHLIEKQMKERTDDSKK